MKVKRGFKEWLHLFLTGFTMGAADVVPGVSGGTMAFILGIYSELIEKTAQLGSDALHLLPRFRIAEFFKKVPWTFFIVLCSGILGAIVSFASLISHLLETYPAFVFSFFGGLILASAIAVCGISTFSRSAWISLVLCTVITAWIVGLNPMQSSNHSLPVLFVSGMIAISAMVLPGISGSFILLLLGQYQYILNAVHERNLLVVATVAAGCGIGILLAVHVVNFLLRRFHSITIAGLVGIMIGSLRLIYSKVVDGLHGFPGVMPELTLVALLFLAGFVLVTLLDQIQSRKNPVCRLFCRTSVRAL